MSELSYLGENWIFMIFFSCISCITVLWGKPVNLPALNKTPLQRCTHCTIYSAPSPAEEGMLGRIRMGCAHGVCCLRNLTASLEPGWSTAALNPWGNPSARHSDLSWSPALSFPQREPGLAQECSLTEAAWASPRGVWSSASSQVNESRPWLVHLIDWLMIFQPGYKSPLTSVSFSEVSTKEILTSPPSDAKGAVCFPAEASTQPLQGEKRGHGI